MFTVILSIEMLLMTCVGIWMQKIRLVTSDFSVQLTIFLMNIALPCLIFSSMTGVEASIQQLINCLAAFGCSSIVCALQFILGQIVYRVMGQNGSARVMRYGIIFTHFSFMGIPVMEALFGAEGLLYYSIFLIPVRALYYGATQSLLVPPEKRENSTTISGRVKRFCSNPCLWAVLIGMAFYVIFGLIWTDFTWTQFVPAGVAAVLSGLCTSIHWVITVLGGVCTPLGLILCGLTLGKYQFRELLHMRYLVLPLLRCVVIPLGFFCIIRALNCVVSIDPVVSVMAVVYTALPVASLTAAYTIQYDPDPEVQFEAAGAVFFSTILSIFTVPIWYHILMTI